MSNKQSHTFNQPFITESGFTLLEPTIAYQTWGTLNDARDNAVLVCHALTGNTEADKWFGGLFGDGKTLDPNRHFIICPNVLGSCYGTTGPTSPNPDKAEPYRADFPPVSVRDMVRLHQLLLDELNIRELEFVIGGSLGGMQALEFTVMDKRVRAAICIGMGKAHSPWAIGISHAQRQAIRTDPDWNGGFYSKEQQPFAGLATARMIAMTSYRSPTDYEQKFGRRLQDDDIRFEVESYLDYQGQKLAQRFDAVSYVRLTRAMDSHDVARGRGSYKDVLGSIPAPILVAGVDSDVLYPPNEQKELAELLGQGTYREITSPHGHDAFLIEFGQMNKLFIDFLTSTKPIES